MWQAAGSKAASGAGSQALVISHFPQSGLTKKGESTYCPFALSVPKGWWFLRSELFSYGNSSPAFLDGISTFVTSKSGGTIHAL
jgi:hypothetical protein